MWADPAANGDLHPSYVLEVHFGEVAVPHAPPQASMLRWGLCCSVQVCGLRWSHCGQQLASGGNDNALCIWDSHFRLLHRLNAHQVRGGVCPQCDNNLCPRPSMTSLDKLFVLPAFRLLPSIRVQLVSGGGGHTVMAVVLIKVASVCRHSAAWQKTLQQAEATPCTFCLQAAVKAVAWCPFQSNLVATGGGTADRCIKFWNTHTGACLSTIDTGSQVG